MYDGNGAPCKVYVFNFQSQGLTDSAAEVEKKANQDFVSQIGCCLLHESYFFWFNVGFH
jgi:hypothetical protein